MLYDSFSCMTAVLCPEEIGTCPWILEAVAIEVGEKVIEGK